LALESAADAEAADGAAAERDVKPVTKKQDSDERTRDGGAYDTDESGDDDGAIFVADDSTTTGRDDDDEREHMAVDAVDGGGGDDDDDESVGDNADDDGGAAAAATLVSARAWPVDRTSLTLLRKFIIEVSHRLRQYKNELLAACVRLVLSVPRELIDVPVLVPSLDTALRLGVGYLPLARVGLDALERWLEVRPRSVAPYLTRVLPRLHDYLLVSTEEEAEVAAVERDEATVRRQQMRVATRLKRNVAEARRVESGLPAAVARDSRARAAGRARCRSAWRARCHGGAQSARRRRRRVGRRVVGCGGGGGWRWRGLDVEQLVGFKLDFLRSSADMHFDSLLPRVLELAEGASARATKVASCELLHSLVLLMSGGARRTSRATTRTQRTCPTRASIRSR
jgi:hypothetical protein